MARYRRRSVRSGFAKRPVNTEKHYVRLIKSSTGSNGIVYFDIAGGSDSAAVYEGSHVKNIYLDIISRAECEVLVYKLSNDSDGPQLATFQTNEGLHNYAGKKDILHYEIFGEGFNRPVLQGWIKNHKSRMGLGDKIQVAIYTKTSTAINGVAIYKEYY